MTNKMEDSMSLVEHARRELELCGQTAEDPGYADSIIRAVEAFSSYGHSGGSAEVAREQLRRLLNGEALAPLTSAPAEWDDRTEISGFPLWQNGRDSRAMSRDGGTTYYLVDEYAAAGHDLTVTPVYTSAPALESP